MQTDLTFNGFDKGFLEFLQNLKQNNTKDWFAKNKNYYDKHIKSSCKNLVYDLGNYFYSNHLPYVADDKISLFRIHRDVRFSPNKDPYKTNIGLYFPFSFNPALAKKSTSIGLYLHFEPNNCFVAGGYYMPEPAELKQFRTRIYEDFEEFDSIINSEIFKSHFTDIMKMTEPLKKVPLGFPKEHPSVEYLKIKDLSFTAVIPENIIYSTELLEFAKQKAEVLTPYLAFLLNN